MSFFENYMVYGRPRPGEYLCAMQNFEVRKTRNLDELGLPHEYLRIEWLTDNGLYIIQRVFENSIKYFASGLCEQIDISGIKLIDLLNEIKERQIKIKLYITEYTTELKRGYNINTFPPKEYVSKTNEVVTSVKTDFEVAPNYKENNTDTKTIVRVGDIFDVELDGELMTNVQICPALIKRNVAPYWHISRRNQIDDEDFEALDYDFDDSDSSLDYLTAGEFYSNDEKVMEEITYTNDTSKNQFSDRSPFAQAVLGASVGEVVFYKSPDGDHKVIITNIKQNSN